MSAKYFVPDTWIKKCSYLQGVAIGNYPLRPKIDIDYANPPMTV